MFPMRSGCDAGVLEIQNPGADYPEIRDRTTELLRSGHVSDVLIATYDRVIVDEYQDCSVRQHSIVEALNELVPTCVLGDPLQAIFGFGADRLADWSGVCARFPVVGQLVTPHRWINAGAEELGRWLLEVREALLRGDSIDLRDAPPRTRWIHLDGTEDHKRRLIAARTRPAGGSSVLIIADSRSRETQHRFASQTPGAVTVEAVDLKDLITFSANADLGRADLLEVVVRFAETLMTKVGGDDLIKRVRRKLAGSRGASEVEQAAYALLTSPTYDGIAALLSELGRQPGVRTYRPAVLRACLTTLRLCNSDSSLSLSDAALRVREQNRFGARAIYGRSVGSTLLLKGLEADAVVVLDADQLNRSNLYVAMTRGSKELVVCAQRSVLPR